MADADEEVGPNLQAARDTVAAMREAGHIRAVDRALEIALLSLGRAVDDNPGNANLWRQYLDAAKALQEAHDVTSRDNDAVAILEDMRAEFRNQKDSKSRHVRRPSRSDREAAGHPAHAVAEVRRGRRSRTTP